MTPIRRTADRRRRVLYHAHVAPQTPSTPAARRAAEELRAARQPAKAFGSRVHQHLRGRWFSLVPVSRLAMSIVATVVLSISLGLTLLHYLTIAWPALAYRESLARPLQIDRPDSFAAWWLTMLLLLSAGATRLIYVLRRHRRDDYRGHYQLWRLTLIVLLLVCVHSTVDLVAWLGAFLDLIVGDRAVLSGANWLRIVLDVGGIILAMRLITEVYRCRPALVAMLASAALIGLAEAALWRLVVVEGIAQATIVIAAPLLGWSCFLVAATLYLRSMYRQIRNIADGPTLRARLAEWIERRRSRDDDDFESEFFETELEPRPAASDRVAATAMVAKFDQGSQDEEEVDEDDDDDIDRSASETSESTVSKPGLFSRLRRRPKETASNTESAPADSRDSSDDDERPDQDKPKRRWFARRAAKSVREEDDSQSSSEPEPQPESKPAKKPWFSLRLKPKRIEDDAAASEEAPKPEADQTDAEPTRKRGWFGGLLRRKQSTSGEEASDENAAGATSGTSSRRGGPLSARSQNAGTQGTGSRGGASTAQASSSSRQQSASSSQQARSYQSESDDDDIDPDDIDWNSLSKAERRRLRKKLKRSGRAA